MTSDAQNKANKSNSEHSTGPITAKGLAKSSQNARKHGANAKHLVDADEIAQYENMIVRLKEKYPSDNPLIEMQFARIAKLNVQLKRIQQFIDAAFMLSKDHTMTDEALMDLIGMTETEKVDARKINEENGEVSIVFDKELLEIIAEIGGVNTETFKTPQDFLTHTPLLCDYLYRKASVIGVSITDFISSYLMTQLNGMGRNSSLDGFLRDYQEKRQEIHDLKQENDELRQGIIREASGINTPPTQPKPAKEDAIFKTPLKKLQEATKSIQEIFAKSIHTNHKLYAFNMVRKVEHTPITLEYDNLDKLFRYQTTIQRQLSSAIGELIYINKS